MHRLLYLFIAITIVLTSSCASLPGASVRHDSSSPSGDNAKTGVKPESADERHYPVRSFPTQTLYSLLTAELYGVRGQFDLSLEFYIREARQTRDINVVARSARIARYTEDSDSLAEMTALWIELDPKDLDARELAVFSHIVRNEVDEAFIQARFLLEQNKGEAIRKLPGSVRLPEEQRSELLANYRELAGIYPDNADLLFGYTILLWQTSDIPEALKQCRKVASLEPDNETLQVMQTRLLSLSGRQDEAFDVLESALENNPSSETISQLYVQLIFSTRDIQATETKLKSLNKDYPENESLKFGLALAYQETGQTEAAISLFKDLTTGTSHPDDALLRLGVLAEEAGESDEALDYYRKVRGQKILAATAQIAQLLTKQGNLNDARHYLQQIRTKSPTLAINSYLIESELLMQEHLYGEAHLLLSEALSKHPKHIDLLYSRSLASEKLVNIEAVENDLRQVLEQDSDNSAALNALGYSLANHTTRFQEAQELIEKALSYTPDDPAAIDSLGWVLYRQGQHIEALTHLRRAADTLPDPEISAHLGEVLWVSGELEEARSILAKALKESPAHPVLLETIQRLEVDFD